MFPPIKNGVIANSDKLKINGAYICAKHEYRVYKDKQEDWMFLAVEIIDDTKKINAKWNTQVTYDRKVISDTEHAYEFLKNVGAGKEASSPIIGLSHVSVTFTIKSWNPET